MQPGATLFLPIAHEGLRRFCVGLIILGLITAFGALVSLHLAPTGLSWTRDSISQYGNTKFKFAYRVQAISFGVAGLGAAIGLAFQRYTSPSLVLLTLIFAMSQMLVSWFPIHVPDEEVSPTWRKHAFFAISSHLSALLAALQISSLLIVQVGSPHIHELSNAMPILMLFGLVGLSMNRVAKLSLGGLAERAFYLGVTGWLIVSASAIL